MKLLIFSDNHGDRDNIPHIIKTSSPVDRIISLGDSEMKEPELSELNVIGVKGNFPFEPKFPYDLKFEFEGVTCLFTHGHLYHVKMGLTRILKKAVDEGIDIVCFGHTHHTFLEEINGVILVNPGSLSYWRSNENPTYALIEIDDKSIKVTIYNIYKNIIKIYQKKR